MTPRARKEYYAKVCVELYLKGHNTKEITELASERLSGARITKTFVQRSVSAAITDWKQSKSDMIDAHKAIELEKINRLEAAYWTGWERSLLIKKTTAKKKEKDGKDAQEQIPGKLSLSEVRETESASAGDAKFLDGVEKCIARRCLILGLEAPTRLEADVNANLKASVTHTHITKVIFKAVKSAEILTDEQHN